MTWTDPVLCRHCQRSPRTKSRGLCGRCYNCDTIRQLYPAELRGQYRRRPDYFATPTTAVPGSDEKIQVMMERAANGVSLFHPLDQGSRESLTAAERTHSSRRREDRRLAMLGWQPSDDAPFVTDRRCNDAWRAAYLTNR